MLCFLPGAVYRIRSARTEAMSTPVKPYRVPPPASPGSFHSTSHMVQARRGDDTATDRDVEATKDYAFFHSPKFKICFLSMWCVASMAFEIVNPR